MTTRASLRLVPAARDEVPDRRDASARPASGAGLSAVIAFVLALALGLGPLLDGLYDFSLWGPLALGVLSALALASVAAPPVLSRPAILVLGASVLLLVWVAASASWAASVDRVWTEVNRLALYGGLLALALVLGRHRRAARILLAGVAAAPLVVVVLILGTLLVGDGPGLFRDFRLHEPVEYTNGVAALLLMGFWLMLAAAESAGGAGGRGLGMGGAVAAAGLLVLTQSRAVLPAILVSGFVVLLLLPGRIGRALALLVVAAAVGAGLPWTLEVYASRTGVAGAMPSSEVCRSAGGVVLLTAVLAGACWGLASGRVRLTGAPRRALAAALIAVPLVAAAAGAAVVGDVGGRVDRALDDFRTLRVDDSAAQRFTGGGGYRYDLWRIAVEQFADHPVRGVGAGNYASTYFSERRSPDPVRQPHSLGLQVLGELGLVGGLLLAAAVVGVLLAVRTRPGDVLGPGARVACCGLMVAWFAHTNVDWLHNLPAVTAPAVVAAGLVLTRASGTNTGWAATTSRRMQLGIIGMLVLVSLAAASIGRAYGADVYLGRAQAQIATSPSAAAEAAARSIQLNPYALDARYVLSAAYARFDRYTEARAVLREAARREPFNYVPWALLGDLALRRGDRAQARRDYARARELNPLEPQIVPPA